MTDSPEAEQRQRRCWWKLSEWGFSSLERRAITLLVIFILTGAVVRFFHNSQIGRQLEVWSAQPTNSAPLATQPKLQKININTASVDELGLLPGIGPVRAEAIVAYRANQGEFGSAEDILNVAGIGEKTVAKISQYLQFSSDSSGHDENHAH